MSDSASPPSLLKLDVLNFRRFPSISIELSSTPLIIYGPNGSGKTQILWSLLYFFLGINMRFQYSKHQQTTGVDFSQEAGTVIHPSFVGLKNFKVFINDVSKVEDGYPTAKFTGHFSDSRKVEVKLKSNGVLKLVPQEGSFENKIGFAHLLPFYYFTTQEFISRTILNNFLSKMKEFYSLLSENYQNKILEHIQDLFGPQITKIYYSKADEELYLLEGETVKKSILTTGSAFQKIFSSLILFYHLVIPKTYFKKEGNQEKEYPLIFSEKYLLVEEPEALLYPSLTLAYYKLLVQLCEKNDVKLLITTNDPFIIDLAPRKIALSLEKPDIATDEEVNIRKILGHQVLDSTKELILAVEGTSDAHFIQHILKVQNPENSDQLSQNIQFIHNVGFLSKKEIDIRVTLKTLRALTGKRAVALQDSDFKDNYLERLVYEDKDEIYQWYLPTIECYIFLAYCLHEGPKSLHFLKDNKNYREVVQFYFKKVSSKDINSITSSHHKTLWDDVDKILSKTDEEITEKDYVKVARVLEAKIWMKDKKLEPYDTLKKYITKDSLKKLEELTRIITFVGILTAKK